jgi:hypothetical protein
VSERDQLLALALRAGVLPHEMFEHPVQGLCICLSGVRKIARLAPDQRKAADVVRTMEQVQTLVKSDPAGRA